ncbi:MAG TPA: OmpA family protein [Saprospiraceae bacterium]|nr:OmpA family protein [Saprospiraceae bacterium]HMQ84360.1 OmpA family protein [Saprospiraceae bacterium]
MNKTFRLLLLLAGLWLSIGMLSAQTDTDKNAFSAKVLFIDYGTPNSNDSLSLTNGLELAYVRNFNRFLNLAIPLKVGVANVAEDPNNNHTIASIDGILQLQYAGSEKSRLIPYIMGGGGIVFESDSDESTNFQIPLGAGLNIRVGGRSYVNLQGEYRLSQTDNRNNIQLGLGYLHRFGKQDADKDGIVDHLDACPDQAGPTTTNGCPDDDLDGIVNAEDKCPTLAGKKRFMGCPDTDEDGIPDDMDACPDEAGTKELNGCPDRDGDGIADGVDDCPDEAGLAANNGCPFSDRDGDGINDEMDRCPDEPGSARAAGCPDRDGDGVADLDDLCPDKAGTMSGCPDTDADGIHDGVDACPELVGTAINKGCPELKEEEKEVLNFAMRAVQFETGKATLKPESYDVLNQIVDIMNRYPGYNLRISGHTDNVGDDASNQVLSEERAKSCNQYLASKGINPGRMSHFGFGETKPIASNSNTAGRKLNRRVEFDLYIE